MIGGTHYADQIKGPLTTYVYKSAAGAVKYSKDAALTDKRFMRDRKDGVLVDLGAMFGDYQSIGLYEPEATDLSIVHGILDNIAATPSHFPKESPFIGPTLSEQIRKAGLEREMARLENDKTLMRNEGLSREDIEALTRDEKARLLRKYASPRVNETIMHLISEYNQEAADRTESIRLDKLARAAGGADAAALPAPLAALAGGGTRKVQMTIPSYRVRVPPKSASRVHEPSTQESRDAAQLRNELRVASGKAARGAPRRTGGGAAAAAPAAVAAAELAAWEARTAAATAKR